MGDSPGRVWGGTRSDLVPPLIRQGLRPCHLKRGGRLPPAGASCGATFPQRKVEDPLLTRGWNGEGLGSYFFVVLSVSSVLPWIRASIRVREYSIWL